MLCLEKNTPLETLPPVHYAVPYWEHIHKDVRAWSGQVLPRERSALCDVSLRYMRLRWLLKACQESTRANWAQAFQQLVLENDVVVSRIRQTALRSCIAYLSHQQCPIKINGQKATVCDRNVVQRAIDWEHDTLLQKSNSLSVFWSHVPTGNGDPLHFDGFCERAADGVGAGQGQNAKEIEYVIVPTESAACDVIQKYLREIGPSVHCRPQNGLSLSLTNYTVKIKPRDSNHETLEARPFTSIDRNFGEPVNVYMFRQKVFSTEMQRKVCEALGVDQGGIAVAVHDKFLQFFERSDRGLCGGEHAFCGCLYVSVSVVVGFREARGRLVQR
jgi:hypothetical protein